MVGNDGDLSGGDSADGNGDDVMMMEIDDDVMMM